MKDNTGSKRFHILDAYRGVTMISMVLYHASYDYFIIFMKNYDWLMSKVTFLWQQSICISFIIISGIVWPFGKKHALKRGLILIALGTAITFVTLIFMPNETIYYGILTFMGIATLFTIPYDNLANIIDIKRSGRNDRASAGNSDIIMIFICLILFALTRHFPNGYIGSRSHIITRLPENLYKYPAFAPLGFPPSDFRSSDYFPVLPWIFMYIFGYHLGRILFKIDRIRKLLTYRIPFLTRLGTKSLLVYIIHQPVCYCIVWAIVKLIY